MSEARQSVGRPLRMAFFPMLHVGNAATRLFCDRPRVELARHGVESFLFVPSSPALHRVFHRSGRARSLRIAFYWYAIVAPRRLRQLRRAVRSDVIFVQRSMLRYKSPPVLEAITWLIAGKLLRRRLLYHLDDALYTVAPPAFFRWRCRFADRVLTGNADIAAFAAEAGAVVVRYEGGIEGSRYPQKQHQNVGPVVIGWVGTAASANLAPIVPALVRVCQVRDAVVKIVSAERFIPSDLAPNVIWEEWRLEREFSLFGDFDIGVMPLEDTPYNRGKEAFKIKEYMAAGLPVVCSPVGHNKVVVDHDETGLFATTADEWFDALVRLIDDPDLRERLGRRASAVVAERWSLAKRAQQLAALSHSLVRSTR